MDPANEMCCFATAAQRLRESILFCVRIPFHALGCQQKLRHAVNNYLGLEDP